MVANGQFLAIVSMGWWTSVVADPRSCLEVKQCGEVEADGEYWLYPSIFQGSKVKVYCAGMDTPTPKEYITLPNENFGDYPRKCNKHCRGESKRDCPPQVYANAHHTEYTKIKINILTMVVDREDKTFSEKTGRGNGLKYGEAADCYNIYYNPPTNETLRECGPKGEFKIDSTGTGLKFSPITYIVDGWNGGKYVTSNADNTIIHGYCGGWCGWCEPDSDVTLLLNPDDNLLDEEATSVLCATTNDDWQ